jgi:hypothetical protein
VWCKGCISLFEWTIGYHCQSLTLNTIPVKPLASTQLHYAYSILLIISHGLGHSWGSLSHGRECNLASTTHVHRHINTITQAIMAAEWSNHTEASNCFIDTWNWGWTSINSENLGSACLWVWPFGTGYRMSKVLSTLIKCMNPRARKHVQDVKEPWICLFSMLKYQHVPGKMLRSLIADTYFREPKQTKWCQCRRFKHNCKCMILCF